MSSSQILAKNTLLLTSATVAQKVIAFLYFTLIARFAGLGDTGDYFLALAMVTSIGVLDDIGMTSVIIRDVAQYPDGAARWGRVVLGVKLCTMPLTILLAWFLPPLLGYNAQIIFLVRLAVGVMLADTISLSFYGILRGLHVLAYESFGMFAGQACTALVGAFLVLTGHATLPLLVVALIVGSVWNMFFSVFQVVRRVGWGVLRPSWELGGKPLLSALPFFLSGLSIKIYSYVEAHLLEAWKGSEAVGAYAAAYKLTYAFQFVPLAFVAALYPSMSANAKDADLLRKTLLKSFWYLLFIGSPIVFGIWALAPDIIIRFYTEAFRDAILPLQTMIFVLIFVFLDFPLGSLLNATQHQNTKTAIMAGTMVVSITCNVIFIPLWGPLGAALSGLVSLGGMCIATWIAARRYVAFSLLDVLREVGGSLLAGGLMALLVLMIKASLPLAVTVIIGGVAYLAGAFLFRSLTVEHAREFLRLIRPSREVKL